MEARAGVRKPNHDTDSAFYLTDTTLDVKLDPKPAAQLLGVHSIIIESEYRDSRNHTNPRNAGKRMN